MGMAEWCNMFSPFSRNLNETEYLSNRLVKTVILFQEQSINLIVC